MGRFSLLCLMASSILAPPNLDQIGREIREAWREGGPAANLRVKCRFDLTVKRPDAALGDAYFPNRSTPVSNRSTQRVTVPQKVWAEDLATRGPKYRCDFQFFANPPSTIPDNLEVEKFGDGRESWVYERNRRIAQRMAADSMMARSNLGYYRDMIGFPVLPSGTRSTAGDLAEPYRLDELIPSGQYAIEGEAVVDGEPCLILARPGLDRLWLARDRGWAIVRREWSWTIGGPLKRRFLNGNFREISPGTWIPYASVMEIHGQPGTNAGLEVGVLKATVLDAVADVPDDWFVPHLPEGTRVDDRETGESSLFGVKPKSPEEAARLGIGPMFYAIPWWRSPPTPWLGALALAVLAVWRGVAWKRENGG